MELIGAAFILALAYVYAPLLRVHAAHRTRTPLPAGAVAPEAEAVTVPPAPLPDAIERWCSGWADDAAQEESRAYARELFAQSGDWNDVLQTLERQCQ